MWIPGVGGKFRRGVIQNLDNGSKSQLQPPPPPPPDTSIMGGLLIIFCLAKSTTEASKLQERLFNLYCCRTDVFE